MTLAECNVLCYSQSLCEKDVGKIITNWKGVRIRRCNGRRRQRDGRSEVKGAVLAVG